MLPSSVQALQDEREEARSIRAAQLAETMGCDFYTLTEVQQSRWKEMLDVLRIEY